MAGCDYLPSIKGMGLKLAIDYLDRFVEIKSVVNRVRVEKKFMWKVPEGYLDTV